MSSAARRGSLPGRSTDDDPWASGAQISSPQTVHDHAPGREDRSVVAVAQQDPADQPEPLQVLPRPRAPAPGACRTRTTFRSRSSPDHPAPPGGAAPAIAGKRFAVPRAARSMTFRPSSRPPTSPGPQGSPRMVCSPWRTTPASSVATAAARELQRSESGRTRPRLHRARDRARSTPRGRRCTMITRRPARSGRRSGAGAAVLHQQGLDLVGGQGRLLLLSRVATAQETHRRAACDDPLPLKKRL